MSMMSNSPGRLLAVLSCLAIGMTACAVEPGADTPRQAVSPATVERVKGAGTANQPVVLEKISVRRIDPSDPFVAELLSPVERAAIDNPVLIELSVAVPFDPRPRSAMPVIVLNGKPLMNSRVDAETLGRIRAVVPSMTALGRRNSVVVTWLGAEKETTSPEPLVFTLDDVTG